VITIEHGDVRILLAGDIGREMENLLLERGVIGKLDVLKLSHHGSKTSSSNQFLDTVQPRIAIASVGLFNRYGLPHRPLRERLFRRGIQLFRTDWAGACRVVSDGSDFTVETLETSR
jgi:competence protein ComEC